MDANARPTSFDVTLPGDGAAGRWTHLRNEDEHTADLIELGVPETVAEALAVTAARPRASRFDGGLVLVLRGVNMSPGAEPEDMVSVRMWVKGEHIVTVSPRRVFAVEDVHAAIGTPEGPRTPSEVVALLAETLVERITPFVDKLMDEVERIEERVIETELDELQAPLSQLRRVVAQIRRHLAPQRDALARLYREPPAVLRAQDVEAVREVGDRTQRNVEDLDAIRERALVLRDELDHHASAALNRNTYLMSVVAAVFLPLSLITGVLGINVGGIPGTDSPVAFAIVVVGLLVLTGLELWLLRRLRII